MRIVPSADDESSTKQHTVALLTHDSFSLRELCSDDTDLNDEDDVDDDDWA